MKAFLLIASFLASTVARAEKIECFSDASPWNHHVELTLGETVSEDFRAIVKKGILYINAPNLKVPHIFDVEVKVSPITTRVEVGTSYVINDHGEQPLLKLKHIDWNGVGGIPYFTGVVNFYSVGELNCQFVVH